MNPGFSAEARRDRLVFYACAFTRAMTTSFIGVTVGVYLARIGLRPGSVGVIVGAGLAGAATLTLVTTLVGDRVGRRRALISLAALSALGTLLFAITDNPALLAASAFLGGLNGMGRDRGPALVLEQASLPSTSTDVERTRSIAGHTMLQDIGHALGSLAAAIPGALAHQSPGAEVDASRIGFMACVVLAASAALAYTRLGASAEAGRAPRLAVSRKSRGIMVRICVLFGLDSIGGGFLTTAMLSWFFFERFGVSTTAIATLFFAARVMNAVSHAGAAWLARRIGLVNTMVFTHVPSSILLATAAFAPSFPIAAVLFLVREGLVEMDVPTRQSYVLAVVAPEERTIATGVTSLVRLAGWAIAPMLAGVLVEGTSLVVPLVVGAAIKIVYDVLLYAAFRSIRPPEECSPRPEVPDAIRSTLPTHAAHGDGST